MYLGLGVDATYSNTISNASYSRTKTNPQKYILTGLSPSTAWPFQVNFSLIKADPKSKSTHHISPISQKGIQFDLHRFRSPLLTISQLLSLPPPTKMFQFSGFPILTDQHKKMLGSPIRQSRDQKMSAPPPSLSQLTTTFIGNSSLAIPQIV